MTSASTLPILEITTIYSARSVSHRRAWSGHLVGLVSLLLAIVGQWVLWSRIDPFLSRQFSDSVPLAAYVDITAFFAPPPKDIANPAPPSGTEAQTPAPVRSMVSAEDRLAIYNSANTYTAKLTGSLYGWEVLATVTGLILSLAGAAGLAGQTFAHRFHGVLTLLTGALAVTLVGFCWWVWVNYGRGWELKHVHMLVALLTLFAASLGAMRSRGGLTAHRVAGWFMLVFAAATLFALWWANDLKAMPEGFVTPARYMQVVMPSAVYALLLFYWTRGAHRKQAVA